MKKTSALVSIIVVNWNGKEHLQKCFASLQKTNYPHYEIILVDNASSDGSVAFTKERLPHIKIIQNEKNLGFAEANNIGYRCCRGKYVFF